MTNSRSDQLHNHANEVHDQPDAEAAISNVNVDPDHLASQVEQIAINDHTIPLATNTSEDIVASSDQPADIATSTFQDAEHSDVGDSNSTPTARKDERIILHIRTTQPESEPVTIPDLIFHNFTPATNLETVQIRIQNDHRQLPWPNMQYLSLATGLNIDPSTASEGFTLGEIFGDEAIARSRLGGEHSRLVLHLRVVHPGEMNPTHLRNDNFLNRAEAMRRQAAQIEDERVRQQQRNARSGFGFGVPVRGQVQGVPMALPRSVHYDNGSRDDAAPPGWAPRFERRQDRPRNINYGWGQPTVEAANAAAVPVEHGERYFRNTAPRRRRGPRRGRGHGRGRGRNRSPADNPPRYPRGVGRGIGLENRTTEMEVLRLGAEERTTRERLRRDLMSPLNPLPHLPVTFQPITQIPGEDPSPPRPDIPVRSILQETPDAEGGGQDGPASPDRSLLQGMPLTDDVPPPPYTARGGMRGGDGQVNYNHGAVQCRGIRCRGCGVVRQVCPNHGEVRRRNDAPPPRPPIVEPTANEGAVMSGDLCFWFGIVIGTVLGACFGRFKRG